MINYNFKGTFLSLASGCFSSAFERAVVRPLLKKYPCHWRIQKFWRGWKAMYRTLSQMHVMNNTRLCEKSLLNWINSSANLGGGRTHRPPFYESATDPITGSLLKNYRPVSNLPFVSKLLELMVQVRLQAFLHNQQPSHSTASSIVSRQQC